MAVKTWLDTNGDWSDTANWGGSLATTNDDVVVPRGSADILSGTTALAAVAVDNVRLGVGFTGTFGAVSTPIKFGAMAENIEINSPLAKLISVWPVSCAKVLIYDCGDGPNYAHVYDGNITEMNIYGGGRIVLGALCNITTLNIVGGQGSRPNPTVIIEAGCAITTLTAERGVVNNYSNAITNFIESGHAMVNHLGDSAIGSTSVKLYGDSRMIDKSNGGTHTLIDANDRAVFDLSQTNRAKTCTTLRATGNGSRILVGQHVTATSVIERGGKVIGLPATVSETLPGSQVG